MMLSLVGALLAALGLFSGAALVLVPLGLAPWSAGPALWIFFPLFSVTGWMMLAGAARAGTLRGPSLLLSALLLLLGLGAAVGLVLEATAVVRPAEPTYALWYVLVVAGALGSLGAASYTRARQLP